jgi:hypothetical protein
MSVSAARSGLFTCATCGLLNRVHHFTEKFKFG